MVNFATSARERMSRLAGVSFQVIAAAALLASCRSAPRALASSGSNAACALLIAAPASTNGEPVRNPVASFDSVWAIIERSHWDTTYNGVNWRAVRDTLQPKAAAAQTIGQLRGVLATMIGTLRQSHFSIIPANVSDGDSVTRGGSAVRDQSAGIGATFRDVDGALMLTSVAEGGAGYRAGLRAGFIVDAVNGCPVAPRLTAVANVSNVRRAKLNAWGVGNSLLSGADGDSARIVARDGDGRSALYIAVLENQTGTVTKFGNLPPVSARLAFERQLVGGKTIGVIRFNIWMPVLIEAFSAAIDSLRNADAIVLDLRGNFGGLAGMTTGVAGHFIDSSLTLGTMIQRGSIQRYIINPQRVDGHSQRVRPFAGPLALVVDELSISTTEIFAAGLQELGRARVFGVQTAGQSLPSVAERLPDGDVLYHAVANFLSPTGRPIEGEGVTPDVVVSVSRSSLLAGRDPALDAAVAWAAQTDSNSGASKKKSQH
jgi:carboxyl-terminal processing protease